MPFPYVQRAAVVRQKRDALHAAFAKVLDRNDASAPATQRWLRSIEEFNAALDEAYPPDFAGALVALRRRELQRIDELVEFLEADPRFFRSGYVKTQVLRALKQAPLTGSQVRRLQLAILNVVATRWTREISDYARLSLKLDDAHFREGLGMLLSGDDPQARRRAKRIFATLPAELGGHARDWRRYSE